MKRFALLAAVATTIASPGIAQDSSALLDQLEASVSELENAVDVRLQTPAEAGTERAAQQRLEALRSEIAETRSETTMLGEHVEKLFGEIAERSRAAIGGEPEGNMAPPAVADPVEGLDPGVASTSGPDEPSDEPPTVVVAADEPQDGKPPAEQRVAADDPDMVSAETQQADEESGPGLDILPRQEAAIAEPAAEPITEPVDPPGGDVEITTGPESDSGPLEQNGLSQRVLTLPDAAIYPSPSQSGSSAQADTFSILYVFEERRVDDRDWLLVGTSQERPEGWVLASQTEEWRSMLVMQYAPKSDRGRVVFFSQPENIEDLIDDAYTVEDKVADLYKAIADGSYNEKTIVSIEPNLAVSSDERPYLMPVLAHRRGVFDLDGTVTQLLELAAINTTKDSRDPTVKPENINDDRFSSNADVRDLKIGIAFVIDTTQSMGPYMREAQDFVTGLVRDLEREGTSGNFDFGLVGYRDNLSANSDIGYVTEIFRDFGQGKDLAQFDSDVRAMQPANVSTRNWREDAFAGLDDAINRLSWSQVDVKLVFLITDAGPRTLGDALARNGRLGPTSIAAMTGDRNMSMFIMHMKTDYARSVSRRTDGADDVERGEELYTQLQAAANDTSIRYFGVSSDPEGGFATTLRSLRQQIIDILDQMSRGRKIEVSDVNPSMDPNSPDFDADMYMLGSPVGITEIDTPQRAELVTGAVVSELFRQQQDYLGAKSGVEAPSFYRAWAADRDLINPSRRALEVSVFLNRNQLSDLAKRLDDVVAAMENKEAGMGDFFAEVQERSGRASVDPTLKEFLPEFLLDLPYSTRFQILTEREWSDMSDLQQLEMIDSVKDKSEAYRRINATAENWYQLTRDSSGEEVYPLPLGLLP